MLLNQDNWQMPKGIRGRYRFSANLSKSCWFGVGGKADLLYSPYDDVDLQIFLQSLDKSIPVLVLGVGSNILVRDGGIEGVVIKLGRRFSFIDREDNKVTTGAGTLDANLAYKSVEYELSGGEFFVGIPGTIGGALAMNAGCYQGETADILFSIEGVTRDGSKVTIMKDEMNYHYRGHGMKDDIIFTKANFILTKGKKEEIKNKIIHIQNKRRESQPINSKTSGSTFKNPQGHKAWKLIDQANCRGLRIGGAKVSEIHCNFLINDSNSSSDDLEKIIEEVKKRVFENSGILLQEEIKILGRKLPKI